MQFGYWLISILKTNRQIGHTLGFFSKGYYSCQVVYWNRLIIELIELKEKYSVGISSS